MKIVFENVECGGDSSFACRSFDGPVFECPFHVHPEFEILVIDESSGRSLVGDRIGHFAPGDVYVLGGGLSHMFHNDAPADPSGRARSRFIQFKRDCLGAEFFARPEFARIRDLLERSRRGLLLREGPAATVEAGMRDVFTTSGVRRVSRFLELLDLIAGVDGLAPLAADGFVPVREHRVSARIGKVLAHINDHLADEIHLADVARVAAMSPESLSRFFHRNMGRTFQDYLIELRVCESCRLLLETDLTVAEICFRSGFRNLSNFNEQFLRRRTVSPTRYRMLRHSIAR